MAESHSKGEQRHRPLATASAGSQSPMTRASYGRPFKPYAYGGDKEPPAVTAARERHQALNAALAGRLRELEAKAARRETAAAGDSTRNQPRTGRHDGGVPARNADENGADPAPAAAGAAPSRDAQPLPPLPGTGAS